MDVLHLQQRGGSLLNWAYFCQGKSMDELKQTLLLTTMELENTKIKAQEELKIKDEQIIHLKTLLTRVINEKDEAEDKCQRLILEKLFLLQHQQSSGGGGGPPLSGISSIEDDPRRSGGGAGGGGIDSNNGFSNSDCEESIVSSPVLDPIPAPPPTMTVTTEEQGIPSILPDRPLPEKGKLLQAVMKAGPLLQTLLLAGPLPEWRHPPPPLDTYQIPPPPVVVPSPPTTPTPANSIQQDSLLPITAITSDNSCGRINKKRGFYDDCPYYSSSSPTETKYQRLVLQ